MKSKTISKIPTKKCIFCDIEMEPAISSGPTEDKWETMQPYRGGEVRFLFSYGSCKFDNNSGITTYKGIVCDDCAEKYVSKMEEMECKKSDQTINGSMMRGYDSDHLFLNI